MLPLELDIPVDGSQRGMIAEAVLQALQPLHVRNGGYLEFLGTWNGETEEDLQRVLSGASPAVLVWVGAGRINARAVNRQHVRKRYTVELFVISTSFSSREAQGIGDENRELAGVDPGTYQIIDDLDDMLIGAELGIAGVYLLEPEGETPGNVGETTMWRVTYGIEADGRRTRPREAVLLALRTRHNLVDPSAGVANPVATVDSNL